MNKEFLPFCRPNIIQEDIDAVTSVLKSGWITTGQVNKDLETEICRHIGCKYAVAVSSATAAMHLYLHLMGIGPGDEVITPSMTWVSTVNLICLLGAKPVFVDIDKDNLMTNAAVIEAAITKRTKLIIPVHFAGAPLDLNPIRDVAKRHGIPLIEDAAHALGSKYNSQNVGGTGDAIFSLQAIKNITSAEGGVFVTDNQALADKMRSMKFHGLGLDAFDRSTLGRLPQAEVLQPGFKYNLPDMCAALGLSQFKRIETINAQRASIANYYNEEFKVMGDIRPLSLPNWDHAHCWHLYVIRILSMDRDTFIQSMKEKGIGVGLHFRAVHTHKFYSEQKDLTVSLPNTQWNTERICSLPLFPDMDIATAERVVNSVKEVLQSD